MAMLAEPRQRKRYNLVPRGKALYEDDTRFGTKMLEKMGWSKGKGLGANENGFQDFIRVRYKNDAQGFGYGQRDDQWTQHEDSFNGLLKTLNGEDVGDSKMSAKQSNDSENDMPRVGFGFPNPEEDAKKKADKPKKLKEKISGISLEERSKQSKARVHYKKYTKGKDLSQYSEKDLANIFGKKEVDEQQQATNDYYEQLNKSFGKKEEETKKENEGEISADKLSGVQLFSSGVSVADYFKNKMEEIKNRRYGNNNPVKKVEDITNTEVQEEEVLKKKKNKKSKDQEEVKNLNKNKEEAQNVDNEEPIDKYASNQIFNTGVSVADYFKKKMEEKKNRLNGISENKIEEINSTEIPEDHNSKKKKKKKKEIKEQEEQPENTYSTEVEPTTKTKKSQKRDIDIVENIPKENKEETISKKDKSKKKEKKENIQQQNEMKTTLEEQPKTKKRKNGMIPENKEVMPTENITEIDLSQEPEKKKKKKNKTQESAEVILIEDTSEPETTPEDKTPIIEKKQNKKSKNKKESKEAEASTNDSPSKPTNNNNKKSKKSKTIEVSNEALSLDDQIIDIKSKYQTFNIYRISSFCAEKFRNIDLNHFTGSTLPQVDGYGLTQNIQLQVEIIKNDEERITNLWKNTLDKYNQLEKPKKTYLHYVRDVINARKTKQKRPKLYVKTWKRKNAFQTI